MNYFHYLAFIIEFEYFLRFSSKTKSLTKCNSIKHFRRYTCSCMIWTNKCVCDWLLTHMLIISLYTSKNKHKWTVDKCAIPMYLWPPLHPINLHTFTEYLHTCQWPIQSNQSLNLNNASVGTKKCTSARYVWIAM